MSELIISKPKKQDNGTFFGTIRTVDGGRYVLEAVKSVVVQDKPVHNDSFDGTERFLYIKNSKIRAAIYDVNHEIIEQVKRHCKSWFKNNLKSDLIDEYFNNTIVYDKMYGDLIRLKCIEVEEEVPVNKPLDMSFVLRGIRFYKQKFVLEWVIQSISPSSLEASRLFDVTEDTEDSPEPSKDEMEAILADYEAALMAKKAAAEQRLLKAQEEFASLNKGLDLLRSKNRLEHFYKLCEDVGHLLE